MARTSVEPQRRRQIVDAAIRVVSQKGYEATTIRDVADAAGVSTGTINYYFASKDEALASALVEVAERFGRRIAAAIAAEDDAGARLDRLIGLATPSTPAAIADQVVWGEFWAQAARSPRLRALHERLYDGWRAAIAATVADGVGSGRFRVVEPRGWARGFAALLDGLALHVLLHPGSVGPDEMRQTARSYVAATLSPASGGGYGAAAITSTPPAEAT